MSLSNLQTQWKQLWVSPAKIGWSVEGKSTPGGSRGMLPWESFKFSFKMHIWRLKQVSPNFFHNEYLLLSLTKYL